MLSEREKELAYAKFEEDLLCVLKNDNEHKLIFDNKLAFFNRRFNCQLKAANVHLDKATGELVMVGAFHSGSPVIDNSKGYPVMVKEVEIPLRECYEDMKVSSGLEDRLLDKTWKAVLNKYVYGYMDTFERKGILDRGDLCLEKFGIDDFKVDRNFVRNVFIQDDKVMISRGSSMVSPYDANVRELNIVQIQQLGGCLKGINDMYVSASKVFTDKMGELEPQSASYSENDIKEHNKCALSALYYNSFPLPICNAVARQFTDSDIFDVNVRSVGEISSLVEGFGYKPKQTSSKKKDTRQVHL